MLIINKNSVNEIVLTLAEKTTIVNPTYLFRFTSDFTRQIVVFLASNTSAYTDRYDSFSITETSGVTDFNNGVINLSPTGFWKYEVFEQASTTNLNPALSGAIVETGRIKVIGTDTTHSVYSTETKKYIGYGKGSS